MFYCACVFVGGGGGGGDLRAFQLSYFGFRYSFWRFSVF